MKQTWQTLLTSGTIQFLRIIKTRHKKTINTKNTGRYRYRHECNPTFHIQRGRIPHGNPVQKNSLSASTHPVRRRRIHNRRNRATEKKTPMRNHAGILVYHVCIQRGKLQRHTQPAPCERLETVNPWPNRYKKSVT